MSSQYREEVDVGLVLQRHTPIRSKVSDCFI